MNDKCCFGTVEALKRAIDLQSLGFLTGLLYKAPLTNVWRRTKRAYGHSLLMLASIFGTFSETIVGLYV